MTSTKIAVMITRIGHAEHAAVAERANQSLVTGTVVPPASRIGRAARHAVHAERADEGRHPQPRDQQAVDQAGNDRRRPRAATMPTSMASGSGHVARRAMLVDVRGDDRGQAHDEADRQVDAAGDDDEGLAERQQQRRRREDRDRLQVVGVEDEGAAVGEPRPDLEEDQQQDEEQPGAQLGDARIRSVGRRGVGLRRDMRVVERSRMRPWNCTRIACR